jgi:polysaccharide biosynthesis transport protein
MIIILCVVVIAAFSVVYNYLIKHPEYMSTAQVLVDQPNTVILMTSESGSAVPPPMSVETQMKLLKSMAVAEEATKILNLPISAAAGLSNRIIVSSDQDTGIIKITAMSGNPQECAEISNAFARAFQKVSLGIAEKSFRETLSYIREQLNNAERALTEKELAIYDFNEKNGVVMLTDMMMQRNKIITDLETEKLTSDVETRQIETQIESARFNYNDDTYKVMQDMNVLMDDSGIAKIREDLRYLETDRAGLMVRYKPTHPVIKEIDRKIADIQNKLETYVSDLVSNRLVSPFQYSEDRRILAELETRLLLARSKVGNTASLLEKLKAEQMKYPRLQYEFTRLTREKDVAEKLFLLLYEQLQQAQIEEVRRDVKISIFDRARVPKRPFRPERAKNIAIAIVLGFCVGIGLAFLLEQFEETVRTSDDVKNYLNLPVLGTIPYSAETINKLITDVPLKSPIAEAYRRLSFFTQLFCLDPPIKTLLVTSSKSDEGKSTTLANLAISMAQEGTKVLVVDTDLRRPMLHRMFGVDNSLGLSSILTGELEAEIAVSDLSVSGHLPKESFMDVIVDRLIQTVSIKGLSIIPSGPLPANSIELLRSERMLAFLRCAEKKADIVIFDSPPAIHVIDAVVMSQILDGVLFVINSGRINRDEALQVKYMIESTKTPIIGVALNNIEASSPDYYYYYYYGGYGYGSRQRRKRVKLKR